MGLFGLVQDCEGWMSAAVVGKGYGIVRFCS